MVGERPDVGALRLRRAHRRPNDPERGQTTRESGREPDESSKSGCSTDTAIAAIGSKSRILNSLLASSRPFEQLPPDSWIEALDGRAFREEYRYPTETQIRHDLLSFG